MNLTGKVSNKQEALNVADNITSYHVDIAVMLGDVWVGTLHLPITSEAEFNSYTLGQDATLTLDMVTE